MAPYACDSPQSQKLEKFAAKHLEAFLKSGTSSALLGVTQKRSTRLHCHRPDRSSWLQYPDLCAEELCRLLDLFHRVQQGQ
jgi:hypothetical protein